MRINLKTKIWMAVLAIVLLFAFFILFYFPAQQEKYLLKNYNTEVQNLANTVALGVKIAFTDQDFQGVQTAMEFVKDDPRLRFISVLESDTDWNDDHTRFSLRESVFKTFPENIKVSTGLTSNDSLVVKRAPFSTAIMSGEIMLGFGTSAIIQIKRQIRTTSMVVSSVVFLIGILIGFWLARNISVPVLALRDAANRVGKGDLTQRVSNRSRDEIGELGNAFNKMVDDLSIAQKALTKEKKKSDDLLLNILPEEVATELKQSGKAQARNYRLATVMFADFVEFSRIGEKIPPEELVAAISEYFEAFDAIIERYTVEKIKTVGDAYICAAGLPIPTTDNALVMIKVAGDFLEAVKKLKEKRRLQGRIVFDVRIGINTGPLVAGVVGIKKFAYDIWGDTVNTAARLQEKGEAGRINISGTTHDQIRHIFTCTYRGKISVKNKGEIDMYFVEGGAIERS